MEAQDALGPLPERPWDEGPRALAKRACIMAASSRSERGTMNHHRRLSAAIAALLALPLSTAFSAEYASGRMAPTALPGLSLPAAPTAILSPALPSGAPALS